MRKRNRRAKESKEDSKTRGPSAAHERSGKTLSRSTTENRLPRKPVQLQRTHPPRFAEWLLYFLLSKRESHKIGDLSEHYRNIRPKLGKWGARIWYYKEVTILLLKKLPTVIWSAFYALFEHLFNKHIK